MTGDRRFATVAAAATFLVGLLLGVVAVLARLPGFAMISTLDPADSGPAASLAPWVVGFSALTFAAVFVALTTYAVVREGVPLVYRLGHLVAGVVLLLPLGFLLLLAGVVSLVDPVGLIVAAGSPLVVGVGAGLRVRAWCGTSDGPGSVPWVWGMNLALAVALVAGVLVGAIAAQDVATDLTITAR